jgi:hypothetical protein
MRKGGNMVDLYNSFIYVQIEFEPIMKLQVNEFPHFLKVAYNNTLADLWD